MESAIVTIRNTSGSFEKDMELPTNLAVRALSARLLEVLHAMDDTIFGSFNDLVLMSDGCVLDPEKNLDELCIWDGSVITVRQGG